MSIPVKKTKKVKIGGADTYSLRSATLVEGYFPGAMRQNFRQDPDKMLGKVDFGTFGNDQNYNGPGTLDQALPDGSKYQFRQIFANPRAAINKEVGIDSRQIASYQVEQLHNNPLSQYTTKPDAPIPGFECDAQPSNYSTMVNKREEEYKVYFEDLKPNNWTGATPVPGRAAGSAPNVYQQYTGAPANPNASVVYNMSMNSAETVNPFIAQGSSDVATTKAEFTGKCYSNNFAPGQTIGTNSGMNPPTIYGPNKSDPRTVSDIGFMNQQNNSPSVCIPNPSLDFTNPLILNNLKN